MYVELDPSQGRISPWYNWSKYSDEKNFRPLNRTPRVLEAGLAMDAMNVKSFNLQEYLCRVYQHTLRHTTPVYFGICCDLYAKTVYIRLYCDSRITPVSLLLYPARSVPQDQGSYGHLSL